MSSVVKVGSTIAHSPPGMVHHLREDKPRGGILITKVGDGWEWRYFGDSTVVEMVGAMEMVKDDLLHKDREMS
jgi:hypothetical protein